MSVHPPGEGFIAHYNPQRDVDLLIAQQGILGQWETAEKPKEEKSAMFSIYKDLKEFVREHRGIIFTVVFIALLDKYLFEGALRERLKGIVNGLLGKAERLTNKD